MTIVTRFAPSPTGDLHLGGTRTALFNWLFARQNNGTFILRIEDTDNIRSTHQSAQGIIKSLEWLGLNWDEGPYYQSQRLNIYYKYLDILIKNGCLYQSFETKDELKLMREKAMKENRNPIYDRSALKLTIQQVNKWVEEGKEYVWRFKVPDEGTTIVPELLMGEHNYAVENQTIGDFVVTRPGTKNKPGFPLYNFACAVDDALMGVTHVIRGVEHLPNAAKQVLLLKALDFPIPHFLHLPLIMKDGKKMSKRSKDNSLAFPVSILQRKNVGYLKEAILNYLPLLGWSAPNGQEIFSIAELLSIFNLKRLSKANANFDENKLFFLNSHYIKQLHDREIFEMIKPSLKKANICLAGYNEEKLLRMINLEKARCRVISEIPESISYFFNRPNSDELLGHCFDKDVTMILNKTREHLKYIDNFRKEEIEVALKNTAKDLGLIFSKFGPIIRSAISGRTHSPALADILEILGKEETLVRLGGGSA